MDPDTSGSWPNICKHLSESGKWKENRSGKWEWTMEGVPLRSTFVRALGFPTWLSILRVAQSDDQKRELSTNQLFNAALDLRTRQVMMPYLR